MSTWKLADMIAPAVCIGLAIGRVGCFLNGCCFGHVCTDGNLGVKFPILTSPARELVVDQGYQTRTGFAMDERVREMMFREKPPALVGAVEPGSPAARAGLQAGDKIVEVNGRKIENFYALEKLLLDDWKRGETEMELAVERPGSASPIALPKFTPRTLPLYPTQVYETISMLLLFFLLLTFYPYRRYYGQVFVLLMVGYAFHRFFNETLRNDTDPVVVLSRIGVNLTLSQAGSILVLAAAVILHLFLRKFSPLVAPGSTAAAPARVPVPVASA